jgi:hypothetical protein
MIEKLENVRNGRKNVEPALAVSKERKGAGRCRHVDKI